MPEVRRRRVSAEERPVSRRRDRAVEEVDEDEEDDVDATEAPVRGRRSTKRTSTKSTARRQPEPEDDDDEVDDEEEEEEEEEAPRARRSKTTRTRTLSRREEPDDEEEEEEEAPPRARRKPAAKTSTRRSRDDDEDEEEERPRSRKRKTGLPPGVRTGLAGAEEAARMTGGRNTRLPLGKEQELIKVLEKEPFVNFSQHWVPQGGGQGNRPYTCPGKDCPLCEMGDSPSLQIAFNVLWLSATDGPAHKVLQISNKAFTAFKDAATPRGKEKPVFDRDYWTVNKSGKGNASQTNFRPIKEDDLEDDWEEIFEQFAMYELDAIIDEAAEKNFTPTGYVQTTPLSQLREIARVLADEE